MFQCFAYYYCLVRGSFIRPRLRFIIEGKSAKFECNVLSNTSWYMDNNSSEISKIKRYTNHNMLLLENVKPNETGKYYCLGYGERNEMHISVAYLYVTGTCNVSLLHKVL